MSELQGQVALITGASRGIGLAIARKLAADGATVIGTATSEAGAAGIAENVGGDAHGRVLRVEDAEQAKALVDSIAKEFGGVDILVNNAAITRDTLLLRMKDEDWGAVIDTNLTAASRLARLVLRGMMKKRSGRIICMSSVVGHMGNAGQTSYAAAKAALSGFAKSLAREVASRGVTVNLVAPGFIDTDMTRDLPEDVKENLLGQIPMGRLGDVEDVAAAVSYLASPGASYMTGQTLHVNGGMLMV